MSNVEFDHDYVFDNRAKVVGWVHTHPHFTSYPSNTDNNNTKAWVCSLGKPLVCCIKGVDGLRAHWYEDDESLAIEGQIWKVGKYLFGIIPKKNKKESVEESLDEYDDRIHDTAIKLGYKICYQIWEKNKYGRPKEIWQRYIHPISGRVYRFGDIDRIISDYNNDEEAFYAKAQFWSKDINELLEKEGCKVNEDNVFARSTAPECKAGNLEYNLSIKPRPIEWDDLEEDSKKHEYWKERFGK